MIVLDSSFVLARLLNDPRAPFVRQVMASAPGEFLAPALMVYEVINVLRREFGAGQLNRAERDAAAAAFAAQLIDYDPQPTGATTTVILDLAAQEQLSGYDATFLELALRSGADLATLDGPLADAGWRCGLVVHHIEKDLTQRAHP